MQMFYLGKNGNGKIISEKFLKSEKFGLFSQPVLAETEIFANESEQIITNSHFYLRFNLDLGSHSHRCSKLLIWALFYISVLIM